MSKVLATYHSLHIVQYLTCYLPPTKEEVYVFASVHLSVCLSVCLSVSKITQKGVHGFG